MKDQRRKFVLGAAAVANAAGTFDQPLFTQLTQGLSDWGVNYGELYSVRQEFDGRFYQFLNECEQHKATLAELIETARRQHSTLVFADATVGGVGLGVLDPSLPVLQAWQHRDLRDWSEFLDEAPASSPERALTLAAGMAPALDQLQNRLIDYVDRQLAEWGVPEAQAVCVCYNLAGWAAVEQYLTAVARSGREVFRLPYRPSNFGNVAGVEEVAAEAEASFDEWVANAFKQTLQMVPLSLLTAQVDPSTGVVSLVPQVIFNEGSGADPGSCCQMTVRFEYHQGMRGILAVVKSGETPADYEVVQSWEADVPSNGTLRPRFVLSEPERVQLSADGALWTAEWTREQIEKETPHSVTLGLDLVVILDTLADAPAWDERLKFARDLIEQFQKRLGKSDLLRVAVFAYSDSGHGNPDNARPAALFGQGLKPAAEALNFLKRLNPTSVKENDFEASLEEALQTLAGLRWGQNRQHHVVTIGQRPPHPRTRCYPNQMINRTLDWEALVKNIQSGQKVKSWVVRCPLVWPAATLNPASKEYGERFWKIWGYSGLFDLAGQTPAAVIQAVLSASRQNQPLRIPLLTNSLEE